MSIARFTTALLVAGCGLLQGPFDTADALAAALGGAGVDTAVLARHSDDLFPGAVHTVLCVGGQRASVYTYESEVAAATGAAKIDPADPSTVGSAHVDWVGNPRFWQRGRLLVLYVGPQAGTESLLTSIIGPPFARGDGRGWPGALDGSC